MNNFFSIIITTYNSEKYLIDCLNSISNQTYRNFEIIIIDNFSEDSTIKFIHSYKKLKIKLFKVNNFGIIAKSRNFGIKKSKYNWIAFLDSDDTWDPNKLEYCNKIINNSSSLIFHNLRIIDNKNTIRGIAKGRKLKKPYYKDLIINGNPIYNSSVIVKKSIFKEIEFISENKKIVASCDFHTWLKISFLKNDMTFLNKTLGSYRIHDKSISNQENMSISYKNTIENFINNFSAFELNKIRAYRAYINGIYYKKNIKISNLNWKFALKNGSYRIKFKALINILLNNIKKFNFN